MENQENKLRVLTSSNATFAPTGYGVQTGLLAYGLLKRGFNVRNAANYGLQGAALGFNGLIQYPSLFAEFGEDALKIIIDNWKPHALITLYDIWVGGVTSKVLGVKDWFAALHNRWIPWIPVDHYPIPDPVADQASKAYKPVAMSMFGFSELKRIGLKPTYIPHGVDTNVFKPLDKRAAKAWLEKHSSPFNAQHNAEGRWVAQPTDARIGEESFVVGINAANKDPFRKDFARMFIAFQIFLEQNPDARKDARMHVHSWVQFPGGFDLLQLARKVGIDKYLKHTFTYDMFCGLPPERMADMYNAFDVYLNLCRGGGFEVGHIESAACSVPSIGVDFTSMTELIKDHGWLVPTYANEVRCVLAELCPKHNPQSKSVKARALAHKCEYCKAETCPGTFSYHGGATQFSHLQSLYALPDEWKAAEALADAYNHPDKLKAYGQKSLEFAQGYDFETCVLPKWEAILAEVQSELGMFGKDKRKDDAFDALFKEASA